MIRLLSGLVKLRGAKPKDPRRAARAADPSSLVYYWDGSAPKGDGVRDISQTGAYICTRQHWDIGEIVTLMLRRRGIANSEEASGPPDRSACIPCRVVRHGDDGVGVEFVFTTPAEKTNLLDFVRAIPNERKRTRLDAPESGQALVELALLVPLLFLLVVNIVNFGGFFFAWITVANAARAGAEYGTRAGATIGSPSPATHAQISAVVANNISPLLNKATLAVRVCTNRNSVIACTGTGTGLTPADPEPLSYVLAAIDVTYTYQPYIPLFEFPSLGIHATLPPTAIHRKSVMRMLQ